MNSLIKLDYYDPATNVAQYSVHASSPEFVAAFDRARAWMDAYKATEARFVAANPALSDPIYGEDLPEGTPQYPRFADIQLLLDQFRLGDTYTLDASIIEAFHELGVFDEDLQQGRWE
jgi:hypothetical protein